MSQDRLIHLAESCSAVRASIGRMLLTPENDRNRDDVVASYRQALRSLLQAAREEECGLFLEVAGELSV